MVHDVIFGVDQVRRRVGTVTQHSHITLYIRDVFGGHPECVEKISTFTFTLGDFELGVKADIPALAFGEFGVNDDSLIIAGRKRIEAALLGGVGLLPFSVKLF